ncbi:hypothetical protein K491DRAFT_762285 [Lophiostoma macrostomum CBS 122681]|uniref:DUF7730 domain-containing protein n=1 Tax=Lophiostoma macrostomum CBS 122681 TaxID=1314788 RepID=A0A6A6SPR7_9PLEO|nr:hypothetical protein K491DRAFT_762285 [Lophiostoma macrostomum CBS 122681]
MSLSHRILQWLGTACTERRDSANDWELRWFWPPEGRYARRGRGQLTHRAQTYEKQQSSILIPRKKSTRFWNFPDKHLLFSKSSSTSRLLSLPAEVRTIIWNHAVGGNKIAIFRENNRLAHCILDEENSQTPEVLFSISPLSVPVVVRSIRGTFEEPRRRCKSNTLALMKTCRTVYSESIHLLYSRNIFVLIQNHTLMDLHSTVPRDYFMTIRSLHIHWQLRPPMRTCLGTRYESNYQDFNTALQTLNAGQRIERLSIFVQGPMHGSESYCNMLDILKHYRNITTTAFAVRLPRPIHDHERDAIDQQIKDSGLAIVQPPWEASRSMADQYTGYDVGWRVGTLFSAPTDDSLEAERTSYAIFAPVPKQCLRQPRKEKRRSRRIARRMSRRS